MENNRKLFILAADISSERLNRFKEEAKKLGIETIIIDTYRCDLTDEGLYFDGREILFEKGDVCWCISNSMVNHYVAQHIQSQGVKTWPSIEASRYSDKFFTNSFFRRIGVRTPRTVLINSFSQDQLELQVQRVGGFPCVIKGNKGSMGKSVEIVNSVSEIADFLRGSMKSIGNSNIPFKKTSFQLQEFIKESVGEDFRVICLNGDVLGGIRRVASEGFKANISLGGKAELFDVDSELRKICKRIMNKGDIFYAGIDFIKDKEGYLAIEINSSSQFKGFEERTNVNVAGNIIKELLSS